MLIVTTGIPSGENLEVVGAVFAAACYTKSLPRDIAANLKNWTIGGNLKAYDEMMEQSVSVALERLRKKATELGADAVYCLRIATPSVAAGAAEVIAYGTAVKKI